VAGPVLRQSVSGPRLEHIYLLQPATHVRADEKVV